MNIFVDVSVMEKKAFATWFHFWHAQEIWPICLQST